MLVMAHFHKFPHAYSSSLTDGLPLLVQPTMQQSQTQHDIRTNTTCFRKTVISLFFSPHF